VPGLRRLYAPQRVAIRTDSGGAPATVEGIAVEAVREEWLVEDRWWTARPLRRRYFELATVEGANRVVFRELESGRWFSQSGA
jgi:hypothetical protein